MNCRRSCFDRSRESDKCTDRGGEGETRIESGIFHFSSFLAFVDGGKLKRVERENRGIGENPGIMKTLFR